MAGELNEQQNQSLPPTHPWRGFAHPDHQPEDLQRLLRVLRAALTDLQVLRIEAQTTPFFKAGMKGASLETYHRSITWLLANAHWKEKILHPELPPLLANPTTRKMVQEFARTVLAVRTLLDDVRSKLSQVPAKEGELRAFCRLLKEAESLVDEFQLATFTRAQVSEQTILASARFEKDRGIQAYFEQIAQELGAPVATHSRQGWKILRAVECIERIPLAVRPWRMEHIVDPMSRLLLQTWKVKARPILELRKSLESHFNYDPNLSMGDLRELIGALKQEGFFAHFRAPYSNALQKYRALLRDKAARKLDARESDFQRAERLVEWIGFLEQSRIFEQNEEAQAAFAPYFRGVDTDFTSAIEANTWSQKVREDLQAMDADASDPSFDLALVDFVRHIPEDKIPLAVQLLRSEQAREIQEVLKQARFSGGFSFAERTGAMEVRLQGLQRFEAVSDAIGMSAELRLSALKELIERSEEMFFLIHWMNSQLELKLCLKSFYNGPFTDLQALETSSSYVRLVKGSGLPEPVISALLTASGPTQLSEAKPALLRSLAALDTVRTHYAKLDGATLKQTTQHGSGFSLESLSVDEVMERLQGALKQPQLFLEAVALLKGGRTSAGLTVEAPESSNGAGRGEQQSL